MKTTHTYILETLRCRLRQMNEDDADFAFELNNDPEVIQYTGDGPFSSPDEARDFLKEYRSVYIRNGYGRWGVEDKATGQLIGWCGLKFHPEENVTDIGYRFLRSAWGKGFATETASAVMQYGFNDLGLNRIIAHARKENTASLRVLEKLGMKIIGESEDCGGEIFVFEKQHFSQGT